MKLFGRRMIYSSASVINADNVVDEVNKALACHAENLVEEEYLNWYRRGLQPILDRRKEVRPEICNKIVVNNAEMVVTFKNGYFLTKPATYVGRRDGEEITEKVRQLNEYLYLSGKHEADNEVVDSFDTVGLGIIYVEPNREDDVECPAKVYSLDPRAAFVVYSMNPGNRPIMGINAVIIDNTLYADVFTEDSMFRLRGRTVTDDEIKLGIKPDMTISDLVSVEPNVIGKIPIIEYRYNNLRMGSFECALDIMDAINQVESDRADGIEQFIQSLTVLYNCEIEKGTTSNDIRKAGLIQLKSVGENKADIKILSEQLDQSQTQTTLDDLYEQLLDKVGVPSTVRDAGSTSDNVGAVYLRSGWQMADTHARNTEDEFKKSNALFDEVFLAILKKKVGFEIKKSDFELKIVRNETSNILVKTQAAMNMKELGFAPEIAFERSGLSNDPLSDIEVSKAYIDAKWNPAEMPVGQPTMAVNGGDDSAK